MFHIGRNLVFLTSTKFMTDTILKSALTNSPKCSAKFVVNLMAKRSWWHNLEDKVSNFDQNVKNKITNWWDKITGKAASKAKE
ncbi:hypothetical protein TSAR_014249 [Trichomalopsis sarcophagae]|uniref:Uncharacterized protein n=1 Tax=Trichomalopsis sarcophagae TaxID=543379 RepID=A0A232FKA3_9HYME|nr:hypothetical protein TSAR_014249 [Trichomalopsis sarcophagae]